MAERDTSGESARRRRPDGRPVGKPFPKGKSGNPGGRPKNTLAELVSRVTKGGATVVALMDAVHRGEQVAGLSPSLKEMMAAGEWLADREHGKATQPLEHSGPDGQPLVVEVVSYAGGDS